MTLSILFKLQKYIHIKVLLNIKKYFFSVSIVIVLNFSNLTVLTLFCCIIYEHYFPCYIFGFTIYPFDFNFTDMCLIVMIGYRDKLEVGLVLVILIISQHILNLGNNTNLM